MDEHRRAEYELVVHRFFGGWSEISRGGEQRRNLRLAGRRNELDVDRRARRHLDGRRLFSGWNEISGRFVLRWHLRFDERRWHLGST